VPSRSSKRRWLVVDFDGTCTEHDTTPLLPKLAALAARHYRKDSNEDIKIHKEDLARRLVQFQELEDEFMKLFGEAKSSLLCTDEGGTEEDEIQSMHDVLDALDEPSNKVTHMVSESRVLQGLGHVDARDLEGMLQLSGVTTHTATATTASENAQDNGESVDKIAVRLRHGCESTLARILSQNEQMNKEESSASPSSHCSGWGLAVLSINWCPALIDASLVRPIVRKRRNILQIDSCDTEIPIWSNHVDGDGKVSLHVPGALAKRERIVELRSHIAQTTTNRNNNNNDDDDVADGESVIVYVGDSSTDLAALLEADIGILMGNSSSTAKIARRWGIDIVPLQERKAHGFGSGANGDVGSMQKKKVLWQVDSWSEIDGMLIELDEEWA